MTDSARWRAALALGSALAAIAAAEFTLRLAGFAYSFQRVPPRAFNERAVRVLCEGDSFTFGVGAGRGEGYPEQLQGLLNAKYGSGRYEVINRGVPASNSSQLLKRLGADLEEWRPAALIVMTGWNDYNLNDTPYWRALGPSQISWSSRAALSVRDFLTSLRVCRLFLVAWKKARGKAPPGACRRYLDIPAARIPEELARLRAQKGTQGADFSDSLGLAVLEERAGRFSEALRDYKRGVKEHPDDAEVHSRLAHMYHLFRDFGRAKAELREALRRDPDDPGARVLMGDYLSGSPGFLTPFAWVGSILRYDLGRIMKMARRHGVRRIFFLTYPNPNPINAVLLRNYAVLAALNQGVMVVDESKFFTSLPEPRKYYSGDEPDILSCHLNALGYGLMARRLMPAIADMAARKTVNLPGRP